MKRSSIIIWAVTLVAIVATFTAKAVIAKYDYQRGVEDTIKEAYEMGLVEPVTLPNGSRTFRWIETHKLGYE